MTIHSRYCPAPKKPITFNAPSKTQQHFRDECDVNNIINRFMKTGMLPQIQADFDFADVSDHMSFEESANLVAHVKEAFMELPSELRKRFDNDPAQVISFLADPANLDEAVQLGLLEKPAQAAAFEPNPQESAPDSGFANQETASEAASESAQGN